MHPLLGNIDTEQLKLPLGFIKIIELILALIVYVALNGWKFEASVFCPDSGISGPKFRYEFSSLDFQSFVLKDCNGTEFKLFDQSYSFTAGFVEFLSVISIIYCLMALFVYLYRWNAYTSDENIPCIDTGITIIIAILWFITFWSYWGKLSKIEDYSSPENIQKLNEGAHFCTKESHCELKTYAMYATLSVSLLSTLGCTVLFSYNIWLTYKETIWFRQRQMNQVPHTAETHTLG